MKVGIIGAMDIEVALLEKAMADEGGMQRSSKAGCELVEGTLRGVPVVLAQCGVGMVNAAACTQLLIDSFAVDAVVNTGVAGSLDASIDIGDLVAATDAVNHLMDVANLGYEVGQTPGMELSFSCNAHLRKLAAATATELQATLHEGRIASGDRFVRDEAEKQRIADVFDARCCEMEGAAIAQVCSLSDVPCLILRAVSDKADGSQAVDYPVFEENAARTCARFTASLLERMAAER